MTGVTAGQALYAALHPDMDGFVEWEFLPPERRQRFETGAQAVMDARTAEWTHDPLTDIPPGELVHLLSLVDLDEAAEANYEGYRGVTGSRSAVTGQRLPEFPDQRELIRQAWRGGASMVISMLADKLTEAAAQQPQPAPDLAADLRQLANDLEAEGREEISVAQVRQGLRHEVGMNRGRVFELCVSRIRKTLDAQ